MRGDYMSDVEFVFRDGPKGFVKVRKKVVLEPREFYREMPSTGGFENPLVFLAVSESCTSFSKWWFLVYRMQSTPFS